MWELAAIERAIERAIARDHEAIDGHDAEGAQAPESTGATAAQLEALTARAERRRARLQQLDANGETLRNPSFGAVM